MRICRALVIHATIEQEIVYTAAHLLPACRRAAAEAEVEHAVVHGLVGQIRLMAPDDALFDAHVSVLGEYVRHPLDQEEELLLPDLMQSDLDLKALGRQARRRRLALEHALDTQDSPG